MNPRFTTPISVLIVMVLLTGSINRLAGQIQYPILLLGEDKNFGSYTGEILKTEGFNEFQMKPLTDKISYAYLRKFEIVILAETILSEKQHAIIARYVQEGGNLIAFKPDKRMSDIFGIVDRGGTVDDGYIAIHKSDEIGRGLVSVPLQFHGEADLYDLKGGKEIAALYRDAFSETKYPAVVLNKYGNGYAMAFLYNLSKSIVYTRQGNFRRAGQEMDGIDGIRAMDMFTNGWIDTSKNTLNQADEQMRLLTHGIEKMTSYKIPLPRFWYFPDSLKCLVTLTNDGEDSKEAEFEPQFENVYSKGAKMTLYIKETELVSENWVDKWTKKDFEFGAHFDDTRQAQNPDWKTMDSVIRDLKRKPNNKYGIANIRTVTNHWFVWCGKDSNGVSDFAAQAKLEAVNGMELDNNYARYDNRSNQGYFLGAMGTRQGNFTGSGLTMKFADNDGRVINIYQHLCNVYDQQYMEHEDSSGFYDCFKGLMDRSLNDEVYSYISIKAHNAEYFFSKIPLMKMLDYANDRAVPVWTTVKLLDFLKMKDEAFFSDIGWSGKRLAFKISSSLTSDRSLSFIVPYTYKGGKIIKISADGIEAPYSIKSIKGIEYGFVSITSGENYNFKIYYSN